MNSSIRWVKVEDQEPKMGQSCVRAKAFPAKKTRKKKKLAVNLVNNVNVKSQSKIITD